MAGNLIERKHLRMTNRAKLSELLDMLPSGDSLSLSRREMLMGSAAAAVAGVVGGPMLQNAAAAPISKGRTRNALGQVTLPEDAAPVEQQIFYQASDASLAVAMDFYEAVYQRAEATA